MKTSSLSVSLVILSVLLCDTLLVSADDMEGSQHKVILKNGYGFIEFADYRDADDAVHDLNGRDLMGDRVHVELAKGTPRDGRDGYRDRDRGRFRERSRERWDRWGGGRDRFGGGGYGRPRRREGRNERTEYRLVVENLSSRVSWQDLKDYMRQAGEVTYTDAHGKRKNEGLVEFATKSDMKNAMEKLSGKDLNGRKIKLIEERKRKSRSRSGSRSGSGSRSRSRSRSRSGSRKSKSKSRSRSRSESKDRKSDEEGEEKKRKRSRKRSSRSRSSRSRSKSADKDKKDRESRSKSPKDDKDAKANGDEEEDDKKPRKRSRSRSKSRSGSPAEKEGSASPKAKRERTESEASRASKDGGEEVENKSDDEKD